MRIDNRKNDELRNITFQPNFLQFAQSSVLVSYGQTKVICTATAENGVPPFLNEEENGWLTAEYGMIPASCGRRIKRPGSSGVDGRSKEIQRLIGRSLRSVTDLTKFPGITVKVDCDVLQGDGGTRTAAISGSSLTVAQLFKKMIVNREIKEMPLKEMVGSVSVGILEDEILLDLCYQEDSRAIVDMNLVISETGNLIEVQASGEKGTFTQDQFLLMIKTGTHGIEKIIEIEKEILNSAKIEN